MLNISRKRCLICIMKTYQISGLTFYVDSVDKGPGALNTCTVPGRDWKNTHLSYIHWYTLVHYCMPGQVNSRTLDRDIQMYTTFLLRIPAKWAHYWDLPANWREICIAAFGENRRHFTLQSARKLPSAGTYLILGRNALRLTTLAANAMPKKLVSIRALRTIFSTQPLTA